MVHTFGHISSPVKRALEALQRGESAVLQVKKQKRVSVSRPPAANSADAAPSGDWRVHVSIVLNDLDDGIDDDHHENADPGTVVNSTEAEPVMVFLSLTSSASNQSSAVPLHDITNTASVNRRLLRAELKERRANALQQVLHDTHSIHTYHKQQEAFDACDTHNATVQDPTQHLVVWSEELMYSGGKRKYLTATYDNFYHYYTHLPPQHRHFYELLRSDQPCHLYFDIEYKLAYNLHITAEQSQHMTQVFIDCLIGLLYTKYSIELSRSGIVILDSSSDVKFSCHLICHLENGHTVFGSNIHAGHFVHKLCQQIRDGAVGGDQRMQSLYINTDASGLKQELFVDEGVYTKNRCMRLYLSSKAAPQRTALPVKLQPLKRSSVCQYKQAANDREYFFASLASYTPSSQRLLDCECADTSRDRPKRIVLPLNTVQPQSREPADGSNEHQRLHDWVQQFVSEWGSGRGTVKSIMLVGCSTQTSGSAQSADAVANQIAQQPAAFTYNVVGDRFCTNIDRQHRSNGIYFVVSLPKRTVIQRCYDRDCRQHSSQPVPIPGDVFVEDVVAQDDGIDWYALAV